MWMEMQHTGFTRHGFSIFLATSLLFTNISVVGAGSSGASRNPAALQKKPSVPTGLTAIWSGTKQVSLAWNAAKGAARYNIKRSKAPGGPYTVVRKQKRRAFKDTKVTIGSLYYYVVSAANAGGESGNSTEVSPTLPPTGLAAVPADEQVTLSWIGSTGATRYNVKRATSPGGPFTTVDSPTATTCTDARLTNGTPYYYVVSSVNGAGESFNSSEAHTTPTSSSTPPPKPTGLTATPGDSRVNLAWNASTGATSYQVKRSASQGGPYAAVSAPTSPAYDDQGLTNGTPYYYVVSAVNSAGESENSNEATAVPTAVSSARWVSGYYVYWEWSGGYDADLDASNIDYSAVTHIIDFAAQPRANGTGAIDDVPHDAYITDLINRAHANGVKVLLSVGLDFSDALTHQSTMITNIIALMQAHPYDGVDIDWESPTSGNALDSHWVPFLQAMRARLDSINPNLVMTAAVGLGPLPTTAPDPAAQLIASGSPYLDQINLMTYGMSGPWGGWKSWHSSPLLNGGNTFGPNYYYPSIDGCVQRLISAGVPRSKIAPGFGLVGMRYHGNSGPLQDLLSGWWETDLYYGQILDQILHLPSVSSVSFSYDTGAQTNYVSFSDTTCACGMTQHYISYMDQDAVTRACQYVKDTQLGGAMIWHLRSGYRSSLASGTKDALLQIMKHSLLGR